MHGSGNDFILIDNRKGILSKPHMGEFAAKVCQRKFFVGADGLIFIENSETADFKWQFFNADGSEAEMCGNGGRCAARFAHLMGIGGNNLSFETRAGIIKAAVDGEKIKLEMTEPSGIILDTKLFLEEDEHILHSVNTGVPHLVEFVDDLAHIDVLRVGRFFRNHKRFQPAGTNVNFITVPDSLNLKIRTYERGVEDETFACGTGCIASALIASCKNLIVSPVLVHTRGGEALKVFFKKTREGFKEIFLEGDAKIAYRGEI